MTPVGHAALERLEPALPCRDTRIRGKTMLEEVEAAAWAKHPSHFCEGDAGIRDRTQRKRAQGVIAVVVGECDGLTVESDVLDNGR